MANNVLKYIAAGFDRLEGQILDGNNIANGTSPSTQVATGAVGSPGFRITGVKTSAITVPEPDVVPVTGDDSYLAGFIFPSANVRSFDIEAAIEDLTNITYFQQTKTYNIGNASVGVLDIPTPTLPSISLIAVSNAKSEQTGSVGNAQFAGVLIPVCQIFPLGRTTFSERAAGVFRARVVMTQGQAFPWGETFTTTNVGTTAGTVVEWSAPHRKAIHRFTGDNGTLTFGPLNYIPASTSLNDVIVYVVDATTGVPTIQTSGVTINQAAKTLTFAVAPTTNSKIVVFYDYVLSL